MKQLISTSFSLPSRAPLALGLCLLLPSIVLAEDHIVEVSSNIFTPANLTIQEGDTVTWRNLGGFHNVAAPGRFRCANGCDGEGGDGNPSGAAWEFTRTFNSADIIDYVCEPHEGVGMVARLTIEAASTAAPGSVQLASAATDVSEGGGAATVTVQRTGGTDGAVTVDIETSDGSATAGADYTATTGTLSWADGDASNQTINVPINDDSATESTESINLLLSRATGGATIGALAAGTIRIIDNDATVSSPGTLQFSAASYSASEADGSVDLVVERVGGTDGAVSVAFATASGSAQEVSDFTSQFGTLDWADGDSSSRTITVQLIDDLDTEGVESFSAALSSPTGGADLGNPSTATVSLLDDDGTGCTGSEEVLCLGTDDRFQASVTWRIRDGSTGTGKIIDIGKEDSGLFFFFDEDNAEMLIKVLNGCPVNNHYWVFFAATTDVEFELTITDTQAETSEVYTNPLGQPANAVTDTSAFATCP